MICKWCARAADGNFPGSSHSWQGEHLEAQGFTCKGGTHCDCQHKEPGTAINKEMSDAGQAD